MKYAEKRAVIPVRGYFPFLVLGRGLHCLFVIFYTMCGTSSVRLFDRSRYSTDCKKNSVFECSEPRERPPFTGCGDEKRNETSHSPTTVAYPKLFFFWGGGLISDKFHSLF